MQQPIQQEIKEMLQRYNLTQQEFAENLGVSISTISRWLNGRSNPTRSMVKAVARLQKEYQEKERSERE